MSWACSGTEEGPGWLGPDGPGGAPSGGTGGSSGSGGSGTGASPGTGGEDGTGGAPPLRGEECGPGFCAVEASCQSELESEPTCVCAAGYTGNGFRCEDINECAGAMPCGPHAQCENAAGTYSCFCEEGYEWNGSSCEDTNECENSPCAQTGSCQNSAGSFSCSCPAGQVGNGFSCIPQEEDPCTSVSCGAGICQPTLAGAICECPEGRYGETCTEICGTELVLEDQALLSAVRSFLNQPTGPILLESLKDRTWLSARDAQIKNLEGLQCWRSLEQVELSDNLELGKTSSSLAALQQLPHLRILDLSCTGLSDFSAIAGHPSLQELSFSALGCEGKQLGLEELSTLSQLSSLELSGLGLQNQDLAQLRNLRNLRRLELSYNQLSSLDEVAQLPRLQELLLRGNQLKQWNATALIPGLRRLDVSYNQLNSLAFVTEAKNLESLAAAQNQLAEWPELSGLTQLSFLDLSLNELNSLEPLADLNIGNVNLSANQISTVEPLLGASFRGRIFLSGNPISCENSDSRRVIQQVKAQGVDLYQLCIR